MIMSKLKPLVGIAGIALFIVVGVFAIAIARDDAEAERKRKADNWRHQLEFMKEMSAKAEQLKEIDFRPRPIDFGTGPKRTDEERERYRKAVEDLIIGQPTQ